MILTNDEKLKERCELEVEKQWFHSVYALLTNNRPSLSSEGYEVAEEAIEAVWKRYCALGLVIGKLEDEQ